MPRKPRLILNDDASNFLYAWDDLGVEDLKVYLSRLRGTQVGMVAYCVAFGGYVTYYESEVAEPVGAGFRLTDRVKQRRWFHNRERLRREVGDYIGFVFATLREMGIPALASFRMNDAHMSSDPSGPVAGRFWMNHPEWRLGQPFGYYASCLDYAVPAVREYLRRLVNEVVAKFPDIAGIELDGLRSPFFFKDGKGRENAPIMTDFIRQIRADLDAAARARGRERYLLWVNVPRSPELALECGMDVAAWDDQGLVDGVSPGCYGTDFQLPIERWKAALGRTLVHAYVNCSRVGSQYLSLEEYRGAAANAYAAGADGIYLFNFPCLDELSSLLPRPIAQRPFPPPDFKAQCWHPDLTHTRQALHELGDPEALVRKDKKFLFYTEPPSYRHWPPEQASIERLAPRPAELCFRCYEDTAQAVEARLDLKLVGVTIRDHFALALNGQPVAESRIQRLHAPGGRDTRIHGTRLEPYSLYTVDVRDGLRRGENRLTVALTARDPDLLGRIEVREMELSIGHETYIVNPHVTAQDASPCQQSHSPPLTGGAGGG
ncbi:MAG: hypothetical protein FJ272_14295 [Planctomycetes bacterium]|nr:hypothetical protein [Planctomycetota bacterium]